MSRVCSIFAQMLGQIPRTTFHKAVLEHAAERHARGFTCWGQLVAMLFCHLAQARSLREICNGLAASEGKLKRLGIATAPSRSTLVGQDRILRAVFKRAARLFFAADQRVSNPLQVANLPYMSFAAQGRDRIDLRRPPRRQIAGEQRHSGQQQRHRTDHHRIQRPNLVEDSRQHAR
jgi:hypothetical protein